MMENMKRQEEMNLYYERMKNIPILERHKEIAVVEGCSFPYHPNPIATGAFTIEDGYVICECCGEETKVVYAGEFFSREEEIPLFCPKCVESGAAAKKYNGRFTPVSWRDYDTGDDTETNIIETCTPSYCFIQQPEWLSHCGEYCLYLGELKEEDLTPALRAELTETWISSWDIKAVLNALAYIYEGHLFYCKECGKHILLADRD